MIDLKISPVVFDKESHTYTLDGKRLRGITGTLVKRAYADTYQCPAGMSEERWEEVLRQAAERGTAVHEALELWDDLHISEPDYMETVAEYARMLVERGLEHVASEYIVSDETRYATAIDKVYVDADGGVVLADVKTTAVLHHAEVALQLNVCRKFFEMQNAGFKVGGMLVLWVRDGKVQVYPVGMLSDAMLDELIAADVADVAFDMTAYMGGLPQLVADVEDEVIRLKRAAADAKQRESELTKGLLELMSAHGVKSYDSGRLKLSRVLPTVKRTFDVKAFASDYPDLYEKYMKETETKESLRITVRD